MQEIALHTFDEYLTVAGAAAFLGVSPWTVRNWDKAGKLKPIRHPQNGYRIYRQQDLEVLLQTDDLLAKRKGTLTPNFDWNEIGETEHFVQFYETEAYLVESVSGFFAKALVAGEGAVLIATQAHRNRIHKKLGARGLDVAAARECGQCIALDAAETLAKFMVDGSPDPDRFLEVIGGTIARVAQGWPRVRAFGEMVALLWAKGNRAAACRLEELWNDLAKTHSFALFCAYPLSEFGTETDGAPFTEVCTCHSRVIPAENYASLSTGDEQLRAITLLQQKAQALEAEVARRKEAENELSDFVENALEGLHKVGPDGKILWANRAELDLLGYAPEEYIGHHIAEFHADKAVIEDILQRLQAAEELHDYEVRLRCKDGSIKYVLISSNVLWEDGQFIHTRCFTRDITDRKRAEEALRASEYRFARFMQHLPGLAWIKDPEGRYVYANDAAEKAFRTSRAELYGKTDKEIFPPETAAQFRENDQRALASDSGIQAIETLEQADGTHHHSIVSKFPIPGPNGQAVLVGGVAIDITERMRAEEALQEADRRKNEFLAMLAHELRNPLAPIRNAVQIMRQGNGEAVQSASAMLERQVGQMVRLVDDLLDVSRISQGKIELRRGRIELASAVNHAVEAARPLYKSMGHELTVTLPTQPIYLNADPTRLAQVVGNLLNNACKFTDKGGRIGLTVEREGEQAIIRVRDSGIGIAADQLPRLFDMFTQVDTSLERSVSGLGIGLTLVKNLVEMHNGTVDVHSAGLGQGSEFVVRLPIVEEAAKPPPEPTISKPMPTTARCILVVDDNRDSATSLAMLLELTGNETQTAYDGLEAVEAAEKFRPDMILLDIGLPKLNGYEVAHKIREQSWGKGMVLVALTGWGQDEDRRKSKDAGFDAHLVKPVDYAALMTLLAPGPVKKSQLIG